MHMRRYLRASWAPALLVSISVHAGVGVLTQGARHPLSHLESPKAELSRHVEMQIVADTSKEPASVEPASHVKSRLPRQEHTASQASAASPSRVSTAVAHEVAEPLDFTDAPLPVQDAVVKGALAKNDMAAKSQTGARAKKLAPAGNPIGAALTHTSKPEQTLVHPVRLLEENWDCTWPWQAESLNVHQQVVTVRVLVQKDGTVAEVKVVSDPGQGFAQAAATCAKTKHFVPAMSTTGPVKRWSPPIHVHFTRS